MGKDPTIMYSIQTGAYSDKHCPLLLKQGGFDVFAALEWCTGPEGRLSCRV